MKTMSNSHGGRGRSSLCAVSRENSLHLETELIADSILVSVLKSMSFLPPVQLSRSLSVTSAVQLSRAGLSR